MNGFFSPAKNPGPASANTLTTPGAPKPGPVAVGATLAWTAQGRTTVKPRNDTYETGGQTVVRRNEDRFRLSHLKDGLLAAVADGAGSSGLYCGAWAQALVENLSPAPITGTEDLNHWMDGFWEKFSLDHKRQAANDAGRSAKFIREGSCATLLTCWLTQKTGGGVSLNWIGYGDSPLYIFDWTRQEGDYLSVCYPDSLATMSRDPHMLNWKDLPRAESLSTGRIELSGSASVILASDGIGEYILMRLLRDMPVNGLAAALAGEMTEMSRAGTGKLADLARAHQGVSGPGFDIELDDLRTALESDTAFETYIGGLHGAGLMANDDSTVIMIDINGSRGGKVDG